ncbi:hypothetical protein [Flavobacterium sp. TAB 87]|uniref:hypothetical protein n=1 Tax=Flavobacterium sp. TAB 87 TaxID=1729581 RepID=UPI00076DEC67|nr:hypothetical protein [Flavobacterium sp. TAB 87]KVV14442.1 hypothetical protein AP058_02337 [Flavobacterium sp. TAB 87]
MKNLYINTGNTTTIFEELNSALGGTMTSTGEENKILLKSDLVKGRIKSTIFNEGACYIQFNLSFTEDVNISIESTKNTPLFFAYSGYGEIAHSFGYQNDQFKLKAGKSAVINTGGSLNTILSFKKNSRIEFSILGLATTPSNSHQTNEMRNKLRDLFVTENSNSIYKGKSNRRIIENIKKLNEISCKSTASYLAKKKLVHEILEFEIEQYTDGWVHAAEKINQFVQEKVTEVKAFIGSVFSFPTEHSAF